MDILDDLRKIVGPNGVLAPSAVAERSAGFGRRGHLRAFGLVRPNSTGEVSAVLRLCNERGIPVVTHGGLTGVVRGAEAAPHELILSLERMRTIELIDPVQRVAIVQAGVTLQGLQEAADAEGLSFPLDLGGRGSATLGGNASTNAGGNRVFRFGMTRDMILGIEAVLADGSVVSSMNPLIKNNTGYDLKHLFIGSEGTLGVITRLVLRLREKPRSTNAAFVAFEQFEHVVAFLRKMDSSLSGSLSAFEVMWRPFYRLVTSPPAKGRPPLPQEYPYYVLIESLGGNDQTDDDRFATAMEAALEEGLVADAVVAQSGSQYREFWSLRDDVQQVAVGGVPVTFDISLPIAAMEKYVGDIERELAERFGDTAVLFVFGHLGDGNLHVIVRVPREILATAKPEIEELVYGGLKAANGSVSAEHGIGLEKRKWLPISRSDLELDLMRRIKSAFDPKNILNRGKILG